jgi:hypothetical protein
VKYAKTGAADSEQGVFSWFRVPLICTAFSTAHKETSLNKDACATFGHSGRGYMLLVSNRLGHYADVSFRLIFIS